LCWNNNINNSRWIMMTPSNSHGDEIKDGWRYLCNFFLAVWSRE
jgi:hypothetical protein